LVNREGAGVTKLEIGGIVARLLLDAGAVQMARERPFILAAGWASPVYVDCRRLIGSPAARRTVTACAAAFVTSTFARGDIEIVAGAETAGIPFAAWLAEVLDLPLAYVRKRPLGIGRNAQVEGANVENRRVLLVDDLTTDGTSKLTFARGLRMAGADVKAALTIFYNSLFPGVSERLLADSLNLLSLATWDDILRVDDGRHLSTEDRAVLENFRRDPTNWSIRHGGRGSLSDRRRG
jgi:orotate phosphoribosyltransferase